MSYIKFDKGQLINLEYSLNKELIRSNRAGAYASMTIICCNTRKYHGLLVAPQPGIDFENHVLLSTLDETIIQHDAEFNLGIHKYPGGIYQPKGHKYVRDFSMAPVPYLIYRVGGVVLKKEMILMENHDRVLIRYTLMEAHSPTKLRFRPFLAFRNVHSLHRANMFLNDKYENVPNGIRMRLYAGYSPLYMQFSKKPEYVHVPNWYYNIEYQEEMLRGYDYQEDLFVPGFFELSIKKGESIVFSAGTEEVSPGSLKTSYTREINNRIPRDNFENCLYNAAQQFVIKKGNKSEVIAGFPWFGRWGRDTFIALPGLTLISGNENAFWSVINTMVSELKGPLFPNAGNGDGSNFQSVDAPLWFFWALQQYSVITGKSVDIWKNYGKKMKKVLEGYRDGTDYDIKMQDNGLLRAGQPGIALTWMDAVAYGKPVTPRTGLAVEVNALWYNAIRFAMDLAKDAGDKAFVKSWEPLAEMIPAAFVNTFWLKDKQYLADVVNNGEIDRSLRPNQIFAASLPYSMIDDEKKQAVIKSVEKELLTSRGLRTLSPQDKNYKGIYSGNQGQRDEAYHQGTVFPWLLGHFAEAYLNLHGKSGANYIKKLYKGFEEVMTEAGIGTVSEVYDGDPPHKPGGAVSQAWSVAELIRIKYLLDKYEQ